MGTSLLNDDIICVSPKDFIDGPNTPGQPRVTAFENEGMWAGITTVIAKGSPSQWHHHADHDSVMYMLSGQIRVDWGEDGEKSFTMAPGDFAFFKRGVIHPAEVILGDEDIRFVAVRVGKGETVINVDGPGSNVDVSSFE